MSDSLRQTIYQALADTCLIDPHTHINPHAPASSTLADVLGYHYYTELAHSAGMPREHIEAANLGPKEKVERLVHGLAPLENTAQYSWLIAICQRFFDFEEDKLTPDNWEAVYDAAEEKMRIAEWPDLVLEKSNVEAVFLTNDFDDALEGFDTNKYIPCLRTDDLVFHLGKPEVRERLAACSGIEVSDVGTLREALQQRFEHFTRNGARACAISLPPSFSPTQVTDGRAATALDDVLRSGTSAAPAHQDALARRVFWTLAELCDEYNLPFDLMIGVNRGVYPAGVYQGQDLYDSRVSLIQYRELFNAFPEVKFPISVLASVTNQELVSYAWIFPNVLTNGHWWYSNTPSFIERDATARLEAVPQTKQIGYYSDAYKLEFVWPKFDMYRQILAKILTESFVIARGWSEERAIALGKQILRGNVETIFPAREPSPPAEEAIPSDSSATDSWAIAGATGAAVIAPVAGAIAGVFTEPYQASEIEENAEIEEEMEAEIEEAAEEIEAAAEAQIEQAVEEIEEAAEAEIEEAAEEIEEALYDADGDDDEPMEFATIDSSEDMTPEPEVAFDTDQEVADEEDDTELWTGPEETLEVAIEEESIEFEAPLAELETESPVEEFELSETEADLSEPAAELPELETESLALETESLDIDVSLPETETDPLPLESEATEAASEIVFDLDQEASDEEDDDELWTGAEDSLEIESAEPEPPTAEAAPEIVFDSAQEASDEEDDALLWGTDSDEESEGDLTIEPPFNEPPPTELPALEEYTELNDSGTVMPPDDSEEEGFGLLSDGSSVFESDEENTDSEDDGKDTPSPN